MNLTTPLATAYDYLRRPKLLRDLPLYWWLTQRNAHRHEKISEETLCASRTSDTLFIFGSGWSLKSITPEEWRHIAQFQTFGFNWFVRQNFVRTDYHLVKEISYDDTDPTIWKPLLRQYSECLNTNPHYKNTILLMQWGFLAINANRIVGLRWLDDGRQVFPCSFVSRGIYREPTPHFSEGLAHSSGTLSSCVNCAYLMGYTNIVLAGVDLNDRRYFWLHEDETRASDKARGATCADRHNMADPTLDVFARWTRWLGQRGVRLSCYNPHSLLAEVMPVYDSPARRLPDAADSPA